jgi:hypothetical protein
VEQSDRRIYLFDDDFCSLDCLPRPQIFNEALKMPKLLIQKGVLLNQSYKIKKAQIALGL